MYVVLFKVMTRGLVEEDRRQRPVFLIRICFRARFGVLVSRNLSDRGKSKYLFMDVKLLTICRVLVGKKRLLEVERTLRPSSKNQTKLQSTYAVMFLSGSSLFFQLFTQNLL